MLTVIRNIMFQTMPIDCVKQLSLNLSNEQYEFLRESVSVYKHEDSGFSFFLQKCSILGVMNEIKGWSKSRKLTKEEEGNLKLLDTLLKGMKTELLLIDNDNLY